MVDVHNNQCQHNGCRKHANFAIKGNRAVYCVSHHFHAMVNVNNKTCKMVGCDTQVLMENNKGCCLHCYIRVFPNEKITRNYKIKENEVLNFIVEKF